MPNISAEVQNAVSGIPTKISFKGAYFFALQPLSNISDPNSAQGAINGLEALHAGCLPRLVPALKKFREDEQISVTILRIMEAMVLQMIQVNDDDAVDIFVKNGAYEEVVDWISDFKGDSNDKALQSALNIVNSLGKSKADRIPGELVNRLAGALLGSLKETAPLSTADQLIDLAKGATQTPEGVKSLSDSGGVKTIMNYLNSNTVSNADPVEAVPLLLRGIEVVDRVYKHKTADAEGMKSMMKLIDRYDNVPAVRERCVKLMQSMFTREALTHNLAVLKDPGATKAAKHQAMSVLIPISYVPALTAQCAEGDNIATLVQSMISVAGDSGASEPLTGCCKMLGNIAKKPATYQAVMDAGALQASVDILRSTKDPEVAAALCALIAPLVGTQKGAEQFLSGEGLDSLLKLLQANPKNENLVMGVAAVIQSVCQTKTCCDFVCDSEALRAFFKCLESGKCNAAVCEKLTKAMELMTSGVSAAELVDVDSFYKICTTTTERSDCGPVVMRNVAEALKNLASCGDAKSKLDKTQTCGAAFGILSRVPINSPPYHACLRALDLFADEETYNDAVSRTKRSLEGTDSKKTIGQLTVLSALGRVARLKEVVEKGSTDVLLGAHIRKLALQPASAARDAEVKATVDCLTALHPARGDNVRALRTLFEVAKSDEVKHDQNRNPGSQLRHAVMAGTKAIIDTGDLNTEARLDDVTKETLEVMQLFPDDRKLQVVGTEILGSIIKTNAPVGGRCIEQNDGHAFLVNNSRKFKMWADLQIASFDALALLSAAPNDRPEMIGKLQQANIMDAIRGAQSAHPRCDRLRKPLAVVSQRFMPEGYLDQQVKESLRLLRQGIQQQDWGTVQEQLDTLQGLMDTPEGIRIAARTGVVSALTDLLNACVEHENKPLQAQAASMLKNITASTAGAKAAVKSGSAQAIDNIIRKISTLQEPPPVEVLCDLMQTLANISTKDPKEAGVILKAAPICERIGALYTDPVHIQRYRDSLCSMLIAVPPDLRLEDQTCASVYKDLVSQLKSNNSETVGRAAGKLKQWANTNEVTEQMVRGKAVVEHAYQALNLHPGTVAVAPLVRLLETLSAVPVDLSDEEAQKRAELLSSLVLASNDQATIVPAMNVLSKLIQGHKNPAAFEGMAVLHDTIRHAQEICGKDKGEIADCIGSILNVVGGEAALVSWLNHCGSLAEAPDAELDLLDALGESDIYLRTHIGKPDMIHEPFDKACSKLGETVSKGEASPEKLAAVAKFVEQAAAAAARVHDENGRQQMAVSLMDNLVDPFAQALLESAGKPNVSPTLTSAGFCALTALLDNPDTRRAAVEACGEGLADVAVELLQSENLKPRDRVLVRQFLNALGRDTDGQRLIEGSVGKQRKSMGNLSNLGWAFKRAGELDTNLDLPEVEAEWDFLLNLLRESEEARTEFWSKPEFMQELDTMATGNPRLLGKKVAIVAAAMAGNANVDNVRALETRVQELRDLFESGQMSQAEVAATARGLITDWKNAGANPDVQTALRRARMFDLVGEMVSEAPRTPGFWKFVIPDLAEVAGMSEQNGNGIVQSVMPSLIRDAALVERDDELKGLVAKMVAALSAHPGQGYNLMQLPNMQQLFTSLSQNVDPSSDFGVEIAELQELCKTDEPKVMNLRKVYALWLKELGNDVPRKRKKLELGKTAEGFSALKEDYVGPVLTPSDCPAVADHIGFVFSEMSSRARSPDVVFDSEAGRETMAGLNCLSLLHMFVQNQEEVEQREEDEIVAAGIMTHRDQKLVQAFILVGLELVHLAPAMTDAFGVVPGFAQAMLAAIQAGRKLGSRGAPSASGLSFTGEDEGEGEAKPPGLDPESDCPLLHRLIFMSKIIPHRRWLEGTSAVIDFVDCWNDADLGKFDDRVTYAAIRCLRASITGACVPYLKEQRVPQRLKALIDDKSTPYQGSCDTFFLLGILGHIWEFKDLVGQVGVVESTLNFIKEHQDEPPDAPSSAAVTNALLALGAICVEHKENTNRFLAGRGIELSVNMIRRAKSEDSTLIPYDRVNAAAVVLCNITFKRDDVKELYAKAKAPQAVMAAIAGYEGDARDEVTRCMASMFKAVGNLVLYAPNVQHFISNGIADVYRAFLAKAGEMPPAVHEAGVRCLSNLLMENDEATMVAMSPLVPILIDDVSNRLGHSEVEIYRNGLEALQYLSRDEANARVALHKEIVRRCLTASETSSSNVVLNAVISFLASVSRHEALVGEISDQGALEVVMNVFHKEKSSNTQLAQKCFITLRRLLVDAATADKFVSQGAAPGILKMITSRAESLSAQTEGVKLLLFLIQKYPPPPEQEEEEEDQWADEPAANEGFLPISAVITRPRGPRSWQQLQLTPAMINELIMTLVQSMAGDNVSTMHRYLEPALMLLGYFAHEKPIGCENAFFNANFFPTATAILDDNAGNVLYADVIAGIAANVAALADEDTFTVYKSHEAFAQALIRAERGIDKVYKVERRYVSSVGALSLDPDSTPLSFLKHASFRFDFDRIAVDERDNANGVQDLPPAVKQILRQGGDFYVITPDRLKGERYTWKASLDLTRLQWGEGKHASNFENTAPVLKCTSIRPGACNKLLQDAKSAHKSKLHYQCVQSRSIIIIGLFCSELPRRKPLSAVRTSGRAGLPPVQE
ncbi:putative arginine N-methyltransferase [Gregarina niphandrodes]|uniref:Vacuolar protein 8 n=1 Tax=Gregarina niphandrodes TaxID=110365 RepID=A0A023AX50_GRENI|nr:putative arginine N-methyltransferase [Gregarina niphandrodes]EZG43311.1 putative arginine N-methyltransferase [Gregarina niphandrodes]|eukprot:XP_011133430.1 putative arginine N-methyltransferase [Gregarina niphandrodes]